MLPSLRRNGGAMGLTGQEWREGYERYRSSQEYERKMAEFRLRLASMTRRPPILDDEEEN